MAFSKQSRLLVACGLLLAVLTCAPPPAAAASSPRPSPSPTPASKDQSVIIGAIGYQDRLLLQETAYKEGHFLMVRDADIVYPKKNEIGYTISCIKVLDQRRDGKNGEVKVKHGGLGAKEVLLRFHSQRGHSLNYVVQVYGH